jgi:uncharacterized membrane protein YdjX (TVP38/TMEM64 family)
MNSEAERKKAQGRTNLFRALILVGIIALTVLLLVYQEQIRQLGAYGYPGIFLLALLSNATIIVPVPGVLLTSAMGMVFNPFWVGIIAGTGAALGELSGYAAGYSGQAVIENARGYETLTRWLQKYGAITIVALAFIPNPLFDMAGLVSGALKMPVRKFLFFCWIGKMLKMLVFAYSGATLYKFLS